MTDDPQELGDNPFAYDPNEPTRCWQCGRIIGLQGCVECEWDDVWRDDDFERTLG